MTHGHKKIYFLAMLLGLSGCRHKTEAPVLEAFPVRIEPAANRTLEERISVTGSLKAKDEATLFSRVPGKLKENVLKEGDRVQKGQTVALVERDEVGVVFEPAPVPSTLTGVVGRIFLDRGANVGLDTPVALVVDDGEVLAKADVPERYAGRAAVGQRVDIKVESFPRRTFNGQVSRVSPVVDPVTRSTSIEVKVLNPEGLLKSGMFAELNVAISMKPSVLSVPASAVTDGSGYHVFIVKDGKAQKRNVTLGLKTDDHIEIKSGLSKGDAVVVSGLFAIKDGSPVDVVADTKPDEKESQEN